jgi:diaminohydroxyphosphoribosylaminopyrimidine deaminase/5-amino-6-(5-phosphoribosylamino)uracil reductase
LTVRDWVGKNPLRIVLDSNLELPGSLNLFDKSTPTLCYNSKKSESLPNLEYVRLNPGFSVHELLSDLNRRRVQSLIVEGGSAVLSQFIEHGLWDEARVFLGKSRFEAGISAPSLNQKPSETLSIGEDLLNIYYYG